MERNAPLTNRTPAIDATGTSALRQANSPKQSTDKTPFTRSTRRIPHRRINGVVAGLIAMFPTKSAATSSPAVQLSDVQAEPLERLRAESLGHRLPPGKGYGDTVGLVRGLAKRRVAPAVMAVEVISY